MTVTVIFIGNPSESLVKEKLEEISKDISYDDCTSGVLYNGGNSETGFAVGAWTITI